MVVREPLLTMDKFVAFVHQDENYDRIFELINGEIVEVAPGRSTISGVAAQINGWIWSYCRENNFPCYLSGEAGTYAILGNAIAPDVAYKSTPQIDDYPDPVPPELAVEVISPSDKKRAIAHKRQIYLDAEILYWEVYVLEQRVDVYPPGEPMRSYTNEDVLSGGAVLPGFRLRLRDIFEK